MYPQKNGLILKSIYAYMTVSFEGYVSGQQNQKLAAEFKRERENFECDPRSGPPANATDDNNIDPVNNVVIYDIRLLNIKQLTNAIRIFRD